MTAVYLLGSYDCRARRETQEHVTAASAREAVEDAAARLGYFFAASLTARYQRDPRPEVRDNAHLQVNRSGTIGFAAWRLDAGGAIAILDAMTPEEHAAYLRTCPEPPQRDALAAAGYARLS